MIRRNELCPCGSGKRYKHCCGQQRPKVGMEALINKSNLVLNGDAMPREQKTIVVLGTARGGTSIAAGALYHLGVPMFSVHRPVFEDVYLGPAFETGDSKSYKEIIKKYNEEPVWAWKRPSSIDYLDVLIQELRNPIFIIMMRDILSVANRNVLSMGHDVLASMGSALEQQKEAS